MNPVLPRGRSNKYKLVYQLTGIIFILLFLTSCEENFNLQTDYKPVYSLNCIIRADTSIHFTTLTKSYSGADFNPLSNSEDPFISGSLIRLWNDDEVYFFEDTLIPRKDSTRFGPLQKAYVLNNFIPAENDLLEIEAILEDGKTLTASARVPEKIAWDTSGARILPDNVYGGNFEVRWIKKSNRGWFHLKLFLRYRKEGPWSPPVSAEIPLTYNGDVPVYTSATKNSGVSFSFSALRKVMENISADQPDKSQIVVHGVVAELLIFDESLSKYISNSRGFMDEYTIRIDQNDYTNVDGGFGIFGTYLKQRGGIMIREDYIKSFGYSVP